MKDHLSHIDHTHKDFMLWMKPKISVFNSLFILFFAIGYIFDTVFFILSIILIVIQIFLYQKKNVNRYIANQPLLLWGIIFIPLMVVSSKKNSCYMFDWIFSISNCNDGILQILQTQIGQILYFMTFLSYIFFNIFFKYTSKWDVRDNNNVIGKKLKQIYVCSCFNKVVDKEDVLHDLVHKEDIESIKELFKKEIKGVFKIRDLDLYKTDKYGRPPLHLAKTPEMVSFLLTKGAEIDDNNCYSWQTLLHIASRTGNLKLAEFLIEKGININKKDVRKRTALDYATNDKMKEFLRKNGGKNAVLYKKIAYFFHEKLGLGF